MTVYAYYRVSTEEQNYESQRIGVVEYAKKHDLSIDKEIVDNGISGTVEVNKRNLGRYIRQMKAGDWLITSEISRIGRSTSNVISTCRKLTRKGVKVFFIKQNLQLDESPMGKMFIAIMSAFAEMERDLMIQRTKEGIERARREGKHIGRAKGSKFEKLAKNSDEIRQMFDNGLSKTDIARKFDVHWNTVNRFVAGKSFTIMKGSKKVRVKCLETQKYTPQSLRRLKIQDVRKVV